MSQPPARDAAAGAGLAVAVLTGINLFNYIDRYVPSAVKDLLKADLHLSDAQTSLPLSAFVIVYMLASPLFGALSDRVPRRLLIALGVALWSVATGAAGLVRGLTGLLLARALVGVGEAAYGTLGPALLSDFYPADRRNRVLTLFYVAIPVGAALGFAIGGALGQRLGWRAAFMLCGFPGLLLSGLTLLVRDPAQPRDPLDPPNPTSPTSPADPPDWPTTLRVLRRNPAYLLAVAGYTAVTFAAGAMADWFPTYLSRLHGFDLAAAGRTVGGATVVGGLLGTLAGGALADRLRGKTRQPYFALSALSMLPAALCAAAALLPIGRTGLVVAMFLAQFFLWFYNGPINATLINVCAPRYRARAFSLSILSIHILGDAISPFIVGAIADATGRLRLGLGLIPLAMLLGVALWGVAWRRAPEAA